MSQGKRVNEMANRMHVAQPKPRDHAVRAAHIPASVLAAKARQAAGLAAEPRKTEKQLEVRQPFRPDFPLLWVDHMWERLSGDSPQG